MNSTMNAASLKPFPGMDRYLEAPDIWPDFHDRLAATLSAMLNAQLPKPYYARIQMRPELGVVLESGSLHRIVPDVAVVRSKPPQLREAAPAYQALTAVRTTTTPGIEVTIRTDALRHAFVEVRDVARDHKLITLIEIVSPANKRPGPDRRAYETKQREVLESDANLIEIDLHRSGARLLPYPELDEAVHRLACDYLILLNRAAGRVGMSMDFTLYPVNLQESLPCIPVPLAGQDPDVPLDIQAAANRAYLEGPYRRALDYAAPPDPPLTDEEAAWSGELLRAAGLR